MPFTTNERVRIRYEIEGRGAPLVLHPGFAGSVEDWEDAGYVAALRDQYRLVRLDPRGQGRSDKPQDPMAYAWRNRVNDVLAVLDAAGIERAHFWGYSMGGWIGFALGATAPDRLRSLIIGGAHPFAEHPRQTTDDVWLDDLQQGMPALVRAREAADPSIWKTPAWRERWLAADAEALTASRRQRLTEPGPPLTAVATMSVPTLLYAGTCDEPEPVERAGRLLPQATFTSLEGLNHAQGNFRSDLVLPQVLPFLARVEDLTSQQV